MHYLAKHVLFFVSNFMNESALWFRLYSALTCLKILICAYLSCSCFVDDGNGLEPTTVSLRREIYVQDRNDNPVITYYVMLSTTDACYKNLNP